MPLQWRLQVLEAQVKDRVACEIRFEEVDLYMLAGEEKDAALDALATGAELPFVIVDGKVACAGPLDAEPVSDAVRLALAASG